MTKRFDIGVFFKKKICFSLDKNIARIWAINTAISAQFGD